MGPGSPQVVLTLVLCENMVLRTPALPAVDTPRRCADGQVVGHPAFNQGLSRTGRALLSPPPLGPSAWGSGVPAHLWLHVLRHKSPGSSVGSCLMGAVCRQCGSRDPPALCAPHPFPELANRTLPLKNVRKRRFRKTAKKKSVESPGVEKEVKRLLSTDAEAVSTRWEIIAENETKETENQGLDMSSPGMSGHRQGHDSLEHDELREVFNDLSSSKDEDETQHQDEEDRNIIDTEEDLERQLQDKLNESDEQHQENEGTNQLVMGIQKQTDNMKGTLQEIQDRAKPQEDLMKVENLALKNRFQAVLDELKQKEDREKEQLSSLQEELESLLEK
ncbi:transcription initiation factor TFIID subunit 7-like [Hippopotamus amphibius kiboko]|uniref:transcription initiation factor TFIID subunit 7-like n=1 Tax=Hippopotamus amphibius kiboko TaxID=575201 RepID=UPI002592DFEB|nr:transcription initiation factor TFIID subunit 7-like [Hippopotamus amphibius kiboko]